MPYSRLWLSISRRRGVICAALLLISRIQVYILDLLVGCEGWVYLASLFSTGQIMDLEGCRAFFSLLRF
jgi:hypothetical protein